MTTAATDPRADFETARAAWLAARKTRKAAERARGPKYGLGATRETQSAVDAAKREEERLWLAAWHAWVPAEGSTKSEQTAEYQSVRRQVG